MRAVVVYESMFGNTRRVAEAVAAGLGAADEVIVVPVRAATRQLLAAADLIVVGGPTHAHGMSRRRTRQAAVGMAGKPGSALRLEPNAGGLGLREWFDQIGLLDARAAAFDTRMHGPAIFTGRASRRIDRLLRAHGLRVVTPPHSFVVTSDNADLASGELDRAHRWGREIAASSPLVRIGGLT